MQALGENIWKKEGASTISKQLYTLMLCFWVGVGIVQAGAAAYIAQDWNMNLWIALGLFLVSMLGIFISLSDVPLVSLVGYSFISIPMGFISGPYFAMYTTSSIIKVFAITLAMVTVLGIVGAAIPDSLDSWGGPLLGAMLVLLVGYFIVPFMGVFGIPVESAMTWLDWAGVAVFSIVVIYDLNRAMRVPFTHDNAIDCAIGVFLDIFNIVIRLQRLTGTKK